MVSPLLISQNFSLLVATRHVSCALHMEDRAFSVATPWLWNSLLEAIRQAESADAFNCVKPVSFLSVFSGF